MTYREAIKDSLDFVELEEIMSLDGEVIQEPGKILAITFPTMLINIAEILMRVAEQACINGPSYKMMGSEFPGKENPGIDDISDVFIGIDIWRHTTLFIHCSSFMKWLLDRDIEDNDNVSWCSLENLGTQWNTFVKMKESENQ